MNKINTGFTLIELLVVIAIIGILASVAMPALSTARDKAVDAKVKTSIGSVKNVAEIYYSDHGSSFVDLCVDSGDITDVIDLVTSAQIAVASPLIQGSVGDGECVSTGTEWTVWVNFRAASTSAYCSDSTGTIKEISAQDSTLVDLTACP